MAPNVGPDVALAGRRANVKSENVVTMIVQITVRLTLEIASDAAALRRGGSFTSLMLHGVSRMEQHARVSVPTNEEGFTVARTPVTTEARGWRLRERVAVRPIVRALGRKGGTASARTRRTCAGDQEKSRGRETAREARAIPEYGARGVLAEDRNGNGARQNRQTGGKAAKVKG